MFEWGEKIVGVERIFTIPHESERTVFSIMPPNDMASVGDRKPPLECSQ